MSSRARGHLWVMIGTVLPTVAVFWANAVFVWNHFVQGPYLHDSGWFAAVMWRSGLVPANPPATHWLPSYYGIHLSPLISVASVLSYLAPIGRVRWYAVCQGAIYAPLGVAVALLIGRTGRKSTLPDAVLVGSIALAFSFNGEVLACSSYPHFEIFIVNGVILMLAGLATGRPSLAWTGLAMAALTREDGGFHASFFAAAVVASDLLGRPFAVAREKVVLMGAVAFGSSIVAFVAQKTCFATANLFRHEYLGEPAFHHISAALLAERGRQLFERSGFVALPLVATTALAIWQRDARYLLGWVAELPWMVLSLISPSENKASFSVYTGFPFVASIYWTGAYARTSAATPTRRGWLIPLVLVSLSSSAGMAFSFPGMPFNYAKNATVPLPAPAALEAFAASLEANPNAFGSIYADPGITSWSPWGIDASSRLFNPVAPNFDGRVGAVFYLDGLWGNGLFEFLTTSPFHACGHMPSTKIFFCGRTEGDIPPAFVRSSAFLALSLGSEGVLRDGETIRVSPTGKPAGLFGPFAHLGKGRYEARWRLRWLRCAPGDGSAATLDAYSSGTLFAKHAVFQHDSSQTLEFTLPTDAQSFELRIWAERCGFVAEDLDLRQLHTAPE